MHVASQMLTAGVSAAKGSSKAPDSSTGSAPRDSLSPLGRQYPEMLSSMENVNAEAEAGRGRSISRIGVGGHDDSRIVTPFLQRMRAVRESAGSGSPRALGAARTSQKLQTAHVASPTDLAGYATASPSVSTISWSSEEATSYREPEACPPRSHTLIIRPRKPHDLKLAKSNGLTTCPAELKQAICDGRSDTGTCVLTTQQSRPTPKRRLPKSPAPPPPAKSPPIPVAMGSEHSKISDPAVQGDNASTNSIARKPLRVLRKSSTNLLFKRMDSKSPLPRPLTATSIVVTQQQSSAGSDADTIHPFNDPPHSARDSIIMLPSASTMTIIETADAQPLSASSTVKDIRKESQSQSASDEEDENENDYENLLPLHAPAHRAEALSPTIPAPSPLPEDSPHKYGLKDRMETPEPAINPQPEHINVAKRRSSAYEIFNEVKSLQSAASFLNGLSTSRRRAESMNRDTDASWATTFTGASTATSRPPSARPPSARPGSARPPSAAYLRATENVNMDSRRRGVLFKANGFAFSRPLAYVQLKCYRNHEKVIVSRNKTAPVECSVCHMDDDQEHWTCTWCAIRMCRYCRNDFSERGTTALRERIKQAELGVSPSSPTESLAGRGRSRAYA
ncbi:hypothetical protein Tdes44962_MAKER03295 [Teratosphaeria destructans]|uniref:Uncharacterized protein n=1 Tax=Teratosphaeria destructans TaxID=418781 RepID=A0A9W7SQL1_9PEZI|nr:hypothetical protein Tdes44962_MAKER03295 [Teratosphaeria destructans]